MEIAVEPASFSSALRGRTHSLHGLAERSGFIADMLHGRASRLGYAIFLRNLLPAYEQLEAGLERHRTRPAIRELALREVYRTDALKADLVELCGRDWRRELPLLAAGKRYADSVARAAQGLGEALPGHAYVRYLGDLNGGQVLSRLLAKSLDLKPAALCFYRFPLIESLDDFRLRYRQALDHSAKWMVDLTVAVDAAVEAFQLNIEVSEAVRDALVELADDPS
jgi:heme oxygenase